MDDHSAEKPQGQAQETGKLSETIENEIIELSRDPQKITKIIQENAQVLKDESTNLFRHPSRSRRWLMGLAVLSIGVSAALFKEYQSTDSNTQAAPPLTPTPDTFLPTPEHTPAPTPTPHQPKFTPQNPTSEIEPALARVVREGDSISSIIAQLHPNKYLDENGKFKQDNFAQEQLYDEISIVLKKNRNLLSVANPELYGAIDKAMTVENPTDINHQIPSFPKGLELKRIVQQTGGPNEVIKVFPGQELVMDSSTTGSSTKPPDIWLKPPEATPTPTPIRPTATPAENSQPQRIPVYSDPLVRNQE